uniref:Uncharacterized protein n=1 Tax=Electrophorus electricus TaxID=8005 RepID=A0A4W4GM64_ELEEL
METYEQFYLRTLTKLESERKYEKNIPRQCTPPAFIYFHGRTVLSPLVSTHLMDICHKLYRLSN